MALWSSMSTSRPSSTGSFFTNLTFIIAPWYRWKQMIWPCLRQPPFCCRSRAPKRVWSTRVYITAWPWSNHCHGVEQSNTELTAWAHNLTKVWPLQILFLSIQKGLWYWPCLVSTLLDLCCDHPHALSKEGSIFKFGISFLGLPFSERRRLLWTGRGKKKKGSCILCEARGDDEYLSIFYVEFLILVNRFVSTMKYPATPFPISKAYQSYFNDWR